MNHLEETQLPPGFILTRTGKVKTPADIVIGGAVRDPLPEMSDDAEAIQAVLLGQRPSRIELFSDHLYRATAPKAFALIFAGMVLIGLVLRFVSRSGGV